MLIKFDFSSKTGILVEKFAFATANLKIETLRTRRRFARVFTRAATWPLFWDTKMVDVTSCENALLRGPAPKKRPMTSGSKIESADFYLQSRGYRILFKNDFLLFQFRFKPKLSSRKLFPSDSSKIRPKISPRKIRFRNRFLGAGPLKFAMYFFVKHCNYVAHNLDE